MNRRLARLEARRPKRATGPMIEFSRLSPEAQALWAAYEGDVGRMTLIQLDLLATELRRFTE